MSALVWSMLLVSVTVPKVTVEVDGYCLREEVAPPFEGLASASWILVRTSTQSLAVSVVTPAQQLERSVPLDGGCAVAAERAALMIERALEPMFADDTHAGLTLPAPPPSPQAVPFAVGASWLLDTGRVRTGPGVFVRAGWGAWYAEVAGGVLLSQSQDVDRGGRTIGTIAAWSLFAEARAARCFDLDVVQTCGRAGIGAERTAGRGSGDLVFDERSVAAWGLRSSATVTVELLPLRPVSAVVFGGVVWRPSPDSFAVDDAGPDWQVPEIAALFGLELGFFGALEIF
ncbi:MAG: hypothetical protein RMA76_19705 [Deltaproteobacteria bacterium]